MKTHRWLTRRNGLCAVATLLSVLGCNVAAAATPATCDMSLTVDLTPDVPDASDPGFLSSLLSNHPSYRLTLRERRSGTQLLLDLTGPGPADRCENVIEAMRKDARVLSIHAQSADAASTGLADSDEAVAVVASALHAEESSATHLAADGIGSLDWAAHHPQQAWRILFPIHADDASGASANIRATCVIFPDPPHDEAAC